MDALLDSQQQRGNHVCGSADDLQEQLRNFLLSKSSGTRAEHASLTFELRYNVVFYLTPEPDGNRAGSADPAQSQMPPPPPQETRTVVASETIQNQPPDDPVLQKAVAKHLISKISSIDASTWNVRQVARGAQGWTFTYICKDSHQAWSRANAKNTERPVIGAFSGNGGLDPINMSRPAFDCRGTLSIAFSKTRRGVIVKYDHTLLHKTVGQLVELLTPAPAPLPVNSGSTRTPKAKRPPPAEGEEGSRKKRPRKKGKAPEAPMETAPLADADQSAQAQNAPENGTQASVAPPTAVLNVPPAEAARRRDTAVNLLRGKGIDPATLSVEQFNIFANQAPQLQEASLDMLARYGAEKLRIVHPDEKDQQPGSADYTPVQAQSMNATPMTSEPGPIPGPNTGEQPALETPTKKRRPRKKAGAAADVSIGDGAVVSLEQNGEIGTTSSTLTLQAQPQAKSKRTRGACVTCKQNKLKCTKEHPACSVCLQSGAQCVYALPKPRRKSEKPAEATEPQDSDIPDEGQRPAPPPMPASQPEPQQNSHPGPAPADPDNDEFIPDPNILSGPVEPHPAGVHVQGSYFPPQDGQAYPPPVSDPDRNSIYPPPQTHGVTTQVTFPPSQDQSQQPAYQQPSAPVTTTATAAPVNQVVQRRPPSSGRHSLPTKQSPVPVPTIPMQNNWNQNPSANTVSPTMAHQAARRLRSRKSGPEIAQQAQHAQQVQHTQQVQHNQQAQHMQDGMQQAAALSQSPVPAPAVPAPPHPRSPAVAKRSPYQATATAARTRSRQGHRSQTTTPVSVSNNPLPQPSSAQQTMSYSSTPSSIPDYNSYNRYNSANNNQYSGSNTDHSSSQIPYKPGSYHANTAVTTSASYSSAPSYDYPRSTASASANPLNQALNSTSGYNSTASSTPTQWSNSQARSQPQPPSSYPSSHGYSNASDQRAATAATSTYTSNQQPYSYSAHQPAANQSQQNWYGFNANSSNNQSYGSSRNAGYSSTSANSSPYQSQRPNVPDYSNQSYSGDQSILDLLKASGASH